MLTNIFVTVETVTIFGERPVELVGMEPEAFLLAGLGVVGEKGEA